MLDICFVEVGLIVVVEVLGEVFAGDGFDHVNMDVSTLEHVPAKGDCVVFVVFKDLADIKAFGEVFC